MNKSTIARKIATGAIDDWIDIVTWLKYGTRLFSSQLCDGWRKDLVYHSVFATCRRLSMPFSQKRAPLPSQRRF